MPRSAGLPRFSLPARVAAALILAAAAALASLAYMASVDASNQRVLSVTAEPPVISAHGGVTTIMVRLPASAAGDSEQVTLTTELGAFTSAIGLPEIRHNLFNVGNDTQGASVKLVADGRSGSSVVRAQVGELVDTVTVRFVGETASLRLTQPSANAKLDAARSHPIRLVASDDTGFGAPSVDVTLTFLAAPAGAELRGGGQTSTDALQLRTNSGGEVSALLESQPGTVRLEAVSGSVSLELEFELYGPPTRLRLVAVDDGVERGGSGKTGSIQALLLDARGQGVPGERIAFRSDSGLVVAWDGDGESPITNEAGTARVHVDGSDAQSLGAASLHASWTDDDTYLEDDLALRVTGPPVAMYLTAAVTYADLGEALLEEYAYSTRYRVEAEVVDELGQRVAGSYRIRWRPRITGAGAQVYPQVTWTAEGVASATFDLQHVDGAPQPATVQAQAWLMDRAQVNNVGRIADLLGEGLPVRRGRNDLVWEGEAMSVEQAVAPIRHTVSAAWRLSEGGAWQAWFPAGIPGAVNFQLQPGDRFHLELNSAARLEDVSRQ